MWTSMSSIIIGWIYIQCLQLFTHFITQRDFKITQLIQLCMRIINSRDWKKNMLQFLITVASNFICTNNKPICMVVGAVLMQNYTFGEYVG